MDRVVLDFETRSGLDLTKVGSKKYLSHYQADIVCLAYRINAEKTKLWLPGCGVAPFNPYEFDRLYAYNASFDHRVWNRLGIMKYNFTNWPFNRTIDVMALCGRYGYPQSLEKAGKVLNLKVQKNRRGKALMKKISCPPFEYTQEELREYYKYCITDVDTLCEMIDALPSDRLSASENRIWQVTCEMNQKGLPIAMEDVQRINSVVKYYKKEQIELFRTITEGELNSPLQTKALTEWIGEQGVEIYDVRADTVRNLLEERGIPDNVTAVLKIRQEVSQSSVAKYEKLCDMVLDSVIYDNLRYYAAGTGRWGGMGFQGQNLPRAKVKNPELIIKSFHDGTVLGKGDVINKAKALIRSMIMAPEGYVLAVADYSAIENRVLMWLAREEAALEILSSGRCMYRDMAAHLFNKAYEDVTEDERFVGKTIILGCGYGLGWMGYIAYAAGYGLTVSTSQAKTGINTYRNRYARVPKFWKGVHRCALKAIANPGHEFCYNNIRFKCVRDRNGTPWLKIELHSGRALVYNHPRRNEGEYGARVMHKGINSKTKQWSDLELSPGRITENIDQALSRDLMANGLINLDDNDFDLRMTVHDEAICMIKDEWGKDVKLELMKDLMCRLPDWAAGIPLSATGYISHRYKKD